MLKKSNIKKVIAATLFSMVVPFAFASLSLSGTTAEKAKSSKYSLKNISSISAAKKNFSLSIFKTNLQYKGSFLFSQKGIINKTAINSFMQFENGNTTYILPFNYSFKVPKFKTPSPNN